MAYQEGKANRTHNAVKCDEDGVFDIDKLCITKEKDRDGQEHEKIDREKRRKLVNLVFEWAPDSYHLITLSLSVLPFSLM